jgi:hypothetical protein
VRKRRLVALIEFFITNLCFTANFSTNIKIVKINCKQFPLRDKLFAEGVFMPFHFFLSLAGFRLK